MSELPKYVFSSHDYAITRVPCRECGGPAFVRFMREDEDTGERTDLGAACERHAVEDSRGLLIFPVVVEPMTIGVLVSENE